MESLSLGFAVWMRDMCRWGLEQKSGTDGWEMRVCGGGIKMTRTLVSG